MVNWFQICKIHVHKEVRDLSMTYHVFLALGFGILTYTAWVENSLIFLVKQIATTVPVLIIIGQIIYHKDDTWIDEDFSSLFEKPKYKENTYKPYLFYPTNPYDDNAHIANIDLTMNEGIHKIF